MDLRRIALASRAARFPRTRGDGPWPANPDPTCYRVSPHSRGWTLSDTINVSTGTGFPALAGMDLARAPAIAIQARFPRTRGDGPRPRKAIPTRPKVSPHSRGWTFNRATIEAGVQGFPALAGMDLQGVGRSPATSRFPRTRGDGPQRGPPARYRRLVSPHSRGWTPPAISWPHRASGFPALAGMDPLSASFSSVTEWFPRTRGDGPPCLMRRAPVVQVSPHSRGWTLICLTQCDPLHGFPRTRGDGPSPAIITHGSGPVSPHSRGWTLDRHLDLFGTQGFPALAGMDHPRVQSHGRPTRFPRTRGDGPVQEHSTRMIAEVSPHSRGWTFTPDGDLAMESGFPALAGMDPLPALQDAHLAGFPRTRGDGPSACSITWPANPVSPHSRGWTRAGAFDPDDRGGFPALAGMDLYARWRSGHGIRFPRTRGDGPPTSVARCSPSRVSPHSRGWTISANRIKQPDDGFPALAGMDPEVSRMPDITMRFPRTRGDGPTCTLTYAEGAAVSPHSRGWTVSITPYRLSTKGFPALAGMDPSIA